jgi:endoglucanase
MDISKTEFKGLRMKQLLKLFKESPLLIFILLIGCISNDDTKPLNEDTIPFQQSFIKNGKLHVENGKLRNSAKKAVQLRGMSTHGIQYFDDFYTENAIKALATGWKADIVRLSLYAREGGYEDDPEYFTQRVSDLIDLATENNLYVLVDWHQLSPGDPNLDKENAKKFFTDIASKYGKYDNVMYDICNEPNNEGAYDDDWNEIPLGYTVTWTQHIKPYAEEIIPIIREYSDNVIIVGTPRWASRPDDVIGHELSDSNVMYSLHFYASDAKGEAQGYLQDAIDAKLPIFITEFGTQNSAGEGANDFVSTRKWLDILDKNDISWCNWNYSPDWRSGAVFETKASLENIEDYSNRDNIKESGKWIMDEIKKPH